MIILYKGLYQVSQCARFFAMFVVDICHFCLLSTSVLQYSSAESSLPPTLNPCGARKTASNYTLTTPFQGGKVTQA